MVVRAFSDPFIGRKNELDIYRKWLTDGQEPILFFSDSEIEEKEKGGIGKTRLLYACKELTEHEFPQVTTVLVDFFSPDDCNGIAIAVRLYSELKKKYTNWRANAFLQLVKRYNKRIQEGLERGLSKESPQFKDDLQVLEEALPEALQQDLAQLNNQLRQMRRAIVIFFDTFEKVEDNPEIAVLPSPQQNFPDNYGLSNIGFVIAGRNQPDKETWNWQDRTIQQVLLQPFNDEEMVDYLDYRGIEIDRKSLRADNLHRQTKGRPILLGLVADIINKQVLSNSQEGSLKQLLKIPSAEFERDLVSPLNMLENLNPEKWIVLFLAHAYHHFNAALLNWLSAEKPLRELVQNDEINSERMLDNLSHLSYIRHSVNGREVVLHDTMRNLVNEHCWKQLEQGAGKSIRQAISQRVIAYYEELLAKEPQNVENQIYRCEILYHKLFLDINDGLAYFQERFRGAMLHWLHPYARALLREVYQFKNQISLEQQCMLWMQEAELLLRENRPYKALPYYKELFYQEKYQEWKQEHRVELLLGMGRCYLQDPDELSKAAENFREVETLVQVEGAEESLEKEADICGDLGYVYRREGNLEEAEKYYERSLGIYKKLKIYQREQADIFNNLSNVYQLQGRFYKALTLCEIGLQERKRLFGENLGGEVAIAMSHNMLGLIYLHMHEITKAVLHLEEARKIFERTYRRRLAGISCRLGEIEMEKHEYDRALEQLELAGKGGDKEVQANSFNKRGRIYFRQNNYKQAKLMQEQAIQLAEISRNVYLKVESQLDLVLVLDQLEEQKQADAILEEAYTQAKYYNYMYLLGQFEKARGDQRYEQKRYQEAFQHYGEACYALSHYSRVEGEDVFSSLHARLIEFVAFTDGQKDISQEKSKVITNLSEFWQKKELDTYFPELIWVCEQVQSYIER